MDIHKSINNRLSMGRRYREIRIYHWDPIRRNILEGGREREREGGGARERVR